MNADDPNGRYFAEAIANPVTYGIEKGDFKATDIQLTPAGSKFSTKIGDDKYSIKSQLPGKFNIYNCLLSIGLARAAGLDVRQVERGIASLKSVEGRMNSIDEGQDFGVIVDYAATPDSFKGSILKLSNDQR